MFITGIFLFAYGGMDMAQGLGWNLVTGLAETTEMQYSWSLGVIIGAIVAALSIVHIPKWVYYVSMKMKCNETKIFLCFYFGSELRRTPAND